MSCLDENAVLDFLGRKMLPEGATDVEAHLAECGACRDLVSCSAEEKPVNAAAALDEGDEADEDENDGPVIEPRASLAQRLSLAQATRLIGTTLCGKWTVERFIGAGGMAHVFSGTHRNGRKVAIKMLKPHLAIEPELVRRFLREGYVANRVEHLGAVAILDDDVADDGAPFLVMELLVGETLKDRLANGGPLPLATALRLADECLSVFEAAHARGVVHRDIKPDNLFITKDGAMKVLDFGIARLRESTQQREAQTHAGQMMGTPGYMAPEQARGRTEAVDARTDVWALGATIYAMLAGEALQKADTVQELLALAMGTPVPPTSRASERVPEAIGEVLDKALSFEAGERFADAGELRAALREAEGRAFGGDGVGERSTVKRRAWLMPIVIGLACVGLGVGVMRSTATATATPSPTPTATATATATPTPTPTATATPTPAPAPSPNTTTSASPRAVPIPTSKAERIARPAPAATQETVERDPLGPRR